MEKLAKEKVKRKNQEREKDVIQQQQQLNLRPQRKQQQAVTKPQESGFSGCSRLHAREGSVHGTEKKTDKLRQPPLAGGDDAAQNVMKFMLPEASTERNWQDAQSTVKTSNVRPGRPLRNRILQEH